MDFSLSESICSELFLHVSFDLDQGQVLKDFLNTDSSANFLVSVGERSSFHPVTVLQRAHIDFS